MNSSDFIKSVSFEEEEGIQFNVINIILNKNTDDFNVANLATSGNCKIILSNNNINRTYYFKNGIETSKEKIIHDERIKSLRR